MFNWYTFTEAFNIYPIAECSHHYVQLRRDVWEELKSFVFYMVMSRWIYMYNVRDYFRGNDHIRRNMDMISKQEFFRSTFSSFLHTALCTLPS